MKKKLLALALAGGLSAGANAAVLTGTVGETQATFTAGTDMAETNAGTLRFTPDGIGHILLVPYYTVQSGNATLLNIVNTDTVNAKAVKVRFRGAQNSDDVFDFQVFMSPGDVWTATITQAADGRAQLDTADNSCTLPATVDGSFVTDRLPGATTDAKNAGTREGYIEIFNMADLPPFTATTAIETIYETTKHNSSGVAACTPSVLAVLELDTNYDTVPEAAALGFNTPTTGLMANWTIVNVPEASSWSGSAAAIVAEVGATPGNGRFVFHPQTSASATITNGNTADPLLRTGLVGGAFFDLPDLSTPYLTVAGLGGTGTTGGLADAQAILLTESLNVQSVMNEFITDPTITAQTSWVFALPTRRYSLGVNYAATGTTDKLVFNEHVFASGSSYNLGAFFGSSSDAQSRNIAGAAYTAPANGNNITLSGDTACIRLRNASAVSGFNRSETQLAGSGFVISPGSATILEFCGEDTVLGFNGTNALGAAIATKDIDMGSFADGWAIILTPGLDTGVGGAGPDNGLPVLGGSFVKANNPGVAAGTSGNFGVSWDHRFVRR